MSEFAVRVFDRQWGAVLLPAGATIAPQAWDSQAQGGPQGAEIRVTGANALDVLQWLGYAIWIMSPDAEYVWWGDIEEIEVSHNGVATGVTLEGVANRVQVLYSVFDPGGEESAGETAWAEDAASIALYGRRERKHSTGVPMREPQAERIRDTLLARVSRPIPMLLDVGDDTETYAILRCKGFWQRLSRVYYANANGLVEHTAGGASWPLGLGFTSDFVASVTRDKRYSIHQIFGRLMHFGDYENLQMTVWGGPFANVYTVLGGDAKEPESYNSDQIKFVPNDDIEDSAHGLDVFAPDDVIQIAGSALNSGTHLVKASTSGRIEISPGYAGDTIQHENAGPAINIRRGNSVEVQQVIGNHHVGPSITIVANGMRMAQSFRTNSPAAWAAVSVELRMRKVGAPVDGVEVRLYTDNSGAPGTWIATAAWDDADISADDGGVWVTADFDLNPTLSPSATYWVEVRRTGPNESDNFYEVWVDAGGGYTDGALLLWNDASWAAPVAPMSMQFRILGAVDTAEQVREICWSLGIFTDATVMQQSGLRTNQYRDGSQYASVEVAELLDTGDGSNTRLIATVGSQRNVTVRPQPATSTAMHIWRGASHLATLQGSRETLGLLPAGGWCHIDDQLLIQGAAAGVSPFFVERASYTPDNGWRLQPAGQPDPWAIGETRNE